MDELLLPVSTGKIEQAEFLLATINSISTTGITLIFDGQSTASQKKYKNINNMDQYAVNDRVVVMKLSGTYIILGKLSATAYPVYKTTTASDIISAGTGFSIVTAAYYRYGRMGMLYIQAKATAASSDNTWKTLGTLVSGKSPSYKLLMKELNGRTNCLYDNGELKIYGTYNNDANFEFSATYIHI